MGYSFGKRGNSGAVPGAVRRWAIILIFLAMGFLSLMIGVDSSVTPANIFRLNEQALRTLLTSRLPRTMAVILSASGLSAAGLIMQAISRNKFMAPSTSGATDAAALGVLLSYIVLGRSSHVLQTVFAFTTALGATLLFTQVINRLKLRELVYVPLIGMMYGGVLSALSTVIAYRFDVMQLMSSINLGSFARIGDFSMIYLIIPPLILAAIYSTAFSIVGMGEDFSKNLGLAYNRVIFGGLMIVSVITAASFVAVGPLPFVGLIIPNMAAYFYGDNLKKTIIDVMLLGAVFVLLCDMVSRLVIFPYEMSVGFTIGIVGGLLFMVLLIRMTRHGKNPRRG
ncbi:MAG: iron chelate uptake ABC transporter family permease subunit [Treponema sp.]|nr:iron chelate uptake ABC transporter family permease subunit [Treponema sp.]